jgi:hypothetical protein
MDQTLIDKAKAAHPGAELFVLANSDHNIEVLVRGPNAGDWKQFRTMQQDDDTAPLALRQLVITCMVHPTPQEFALMLDTRPGLVETFGRQLIKIGGVSAATSVKKV